MLAAMPRSVPPTVFRGQRVLLVGLGLHGGGVATATWLTRQGAKLRVTDKKTAAQLSPALIVLRGLPLTLHLGGHPPADWHWAKRIVVNPDVWPQLPALRQAERRGIPVDNEASIFLREFPGVVVGVTGTRGKTTTTLLLGQMLRQAHRQTIISGNVRQVPMLSYLPTTNASTWAVLELSSYQLERLPVANRPVHVAIMTNLKSDHLDRHGTMARYAATKFRLLANQTTRDTKVLSWDDRWCRKAQRIGHGHTRWFSRSLPPSRDGITIIKGWVVEQLLQRQQKLFPLDEWHLAGRHNLNNLLAAVAGARTMGCTPSVIRSATRTFKGLPYRQERIRTFQGHPFINDTAATSPDGTMAALEVYPQGLFIVGGTDKALDFQPLIDAILQRDVATVFLPGSATKKLQAGLRRGGYRRPLVTAASMPSATHMALSLARPRQAIILSPGAASFGLFIHEFDRGDQFNQAVRALL